MNKENKHTINLITGICRKCGLSLSQKLTTECAGRQLRSDIIKLISNGEIDRIEGNWVDLKHKLTVKITSLNEMPTEVQKAIHEMIGELGSNQEDESSLDELAHELAEVFGKVFKQPEIPEESPDFSDGELNLLQQIKDHPIPVKYVLDLKLSKSNMARLRTLIKHGVVMVCDDHYEVTLYGDGFLIKPEETEPVLTVGDVGLLMFISHEGTMNTSMISDLDALDELGNLRRLSMVYQTLSGYRLTQKGVNYVNKVLTLPLI